MAKYYVDIIIKKKKNDSKFTIVDQSFQEVLNANSPISACVLAWLRLRIPLEGTSWKVNETGFFARKGDKYFNEQDVRDAIEEYEKKKKKDN